MIQTGKAQGKLSPTWMGTDKTPKADMVVGRRGISLKKRGGSQLASAKQELVLIEQAEKQALAQVHQLNEALDEVKLSAFKSASRSSSETIDLTLR